MIAYKEITEPVLLRSSIPAVVEKFRNKVRSYKLVKDAGLVFQSIKGARLSEDHFQFDTEGEVAVEISGMPGLVLRFSGAGEYKRDERRVYLTGFKILNDVGGFANKLIEATGVGVGRSLHVSQQDDDLLVSLFPNGGE